MMESMEVIVQAVTAGMLVMLAGTIARNLLFAANLRYLPHIPWSAAITLIVLWLFWRYTGGAGPPQSTALWRRSSRRARSLPGFVWTWALLAGGLGVVALVLGL